MQQRCNRDATEMQQRCNRRFYNNLLLYREREGEKRGREGGRAGGKERERT
jgi:hypothetical protein